MLSLTDESVTPSSAMSTTTITSSTTAFSVSSTGTVVTSSVSMSPTRSNMNATNTATVGKRIYTFSASKLRFTINYILSLHRYLHTKLIVFNKIL